MDILAFESFLKAHYPVTEVLLLSEALQKGKPTHALYLNTKKMGEDTLLSLYPNLRKHSFIPNAFYYDPEEYDLGKSMWHNLGCFYLLDAASMVVPYFLAPKKDERILDLCAAPGGKTCLCSMMMEGSGVILSNDISHPRSLETSKNVERLGLGNVAVTCGDVTSSVEAFHDYFDAILLDVPCSGTAMFRKEPKMREDWSPSKMHAITSVQADLLEKVASMVGPGGRIAYSTCSFCYEEDEAIVLSFLSKHPEFSAVPLPIRSEFYSHPDLPEAIHLFPHRYEGEGQFLCLLKKDGERKPSGFPVSSRMPRMYREVLTPYAIEGFTFISHGDALYALNAPVRTAGLEVLRPGVKLGAPDFPFKPDHALSSFAKGTVSLSKEDAARYLSGETFPLNEKDGWAVVSHLGVPLGFVKVVRGTAKNHYPKGLRRRY